MKTVIIPAQITTVEDKIIGNLTLVQLVLLILPVILDFLIYGILPRQLRLSLYKLPLLVTVTVIFASMALRIKGKLVLDWVIVLAKYQTRDKLYVFDKNTDYLRPNFTYHTKSQAVKPEPQPAATKPVTVKPSQLKFKLEDFRYSFIKSKKGDFNVFVTKI